MFFKTHSKTNALNVWCSIHVFNVKWCSLVPKSGWGHKLISRKVKSKKKKKKRSQRRKIARYGIVDRERALKSNAAVFVKQLARVMFNMY